MLASDTFLAHLPLIERILGSVCRRNGFPADESEEFAAWAKLRLVDDDYAVIRKFQGRSSFSTYLTTVIANLFRDYRIHRWGKWRPSAEAVRLGPTAVRLETLISRDGRTAVEAIASLASLEGAPPRSDLERLAAKLPARTRRRFESDDELATLAAKESAETALTDAELRATERRVQGALARSLAGIEPAARLALKLRFADGLAVVDIARMLGQPPRPLYGAIDRALGQLNRSLISEGLDAARVAELIGWSGLDLSVDFGDVEVDSSSRPSHFLEK